MKNILKCKFCGYEWATEKDSDSIFYCLKCGAIGHINTQFELIIGNLK